jgi:hypothetical protein
MNALKPARKLPLHSNSGRESGAYMWANRG